MKRIVLVLSFICLTAITSWSAKDDNQFIPIAVLDNTVVTGQTHRAPAFIPMQAYYDGFLTSVCVQFLQNIGDVEVTITNLSTGDYVNYNVGSSTGGVFLPISGVEGTYRIVFLLTSGVEYEGEFEIE